MKRLNYGMSPQWTETLSEHGMKETIHSGTKWINVLHWQHAPLASYINALHSGIKHNF